jgi:hypothetical protein
MVVDFNAYPQRVGDDEDTPRTAENPDWGYRVEADCTTIEAGDMFKHDVVSGLPYRMTYRFGEFGYAGFLIDEDRIIGMKVRFPQDLRAAGWYKTHVPSRTRLLTKQILTTSMSSYSEEASRG